MFWNVNKEVRDNIDDLNATLDGIGVGIKKEINDELKETSLKLEGRFIQEKEVIEESVKKSIEKAESRVEKRLIAFHKEISDKYFNSLESIFKMSKEIALIDALSDRLKDKDFSDFKAKMMQPFLESRWAEKKKQDAEKIESSGERIISRKKILQDRLLEDERHGRDVTKLKEEIKAFDWIISEVCK